MSSSAMLVAVLLKPTRTVASDATDSARHALGDTGSRGARIEDFARVSETVGDSSARGMSDTFESTTGI